MKVGSRSFITSRKLSTNPPSTYNKSVATLCVLLSCGEILSIKKQCNQLLFCYDKLATLHDSPTAYFSTVWYTNCFCYVYKGLTKLLSDLLGNSFWGWSERIYITASVCLSLCYFTNGIIFKNHAIQLRETVLIVWNVVMRLNFIF